MKENGFNDNYDPKQNNIPYCYDDFQELYLSVTEKEGEVNIERVSSRIICELANLFMNQILEKPNSVSGLTHKLLLTNIQQKFPELHLSAKELSHLYLYNQQINQTTYQAKEDEHKDEVIESFPIQQRKKRHQRKQ